MTLDQACAALEAAKVAEAAATAARIDAECAVLAHCQTKDEGSTTARGAEWKATVTFPMYRKVDEAALSAVREQVPAALFDQVFRFKPEVVTAGLKHMRSNEPETYAVLAQAVTATPGKPQVRVEFVGEQREAA